MESTSGSEFGDGSDASSTDGVAGGTVLLGGSCAPCAEKDASCDADGHQAEEGSILDRISRGETPFEFKRGDHLIFSSSVIPVYPNITARDKLDKRLRLSGIKIQTDVHVHGHGSREDLRELIELLNPKHVIPAHGSLDQETPMIDLLKEYGYKFGENSHLSENGKVLKL